MCMRIAFISMLWKRYKIKIISFLCLFEVYDVSYPEVTPTLPPVYRCPNGWHTFRDNCYLIQFDMGNWQEARDQCRSMGADLASIDNSAENEYLAALIAQSKFTILSYILTPSLKKVKLCCIFRPISNLYY